MAQRRAQLGIPLTSDMKALLITFVQFSFLWMLPCLRLLVVTAYQETLRRRPRQLKPKVENDEDKTINSMLV